jgi:hypothetical protein
MTDAERLLYRIFGSVPTSATPLAIDARVIHASSGAEPPEGVRTMRKTIQQVLPEGSTKTLCQQEEYTLFDEAVYVCTHVYAIENTKKAEVFVWKGNSASEAAVESAQTLGKKLVRELGSSPLQLLRQCHEPASLLQALGGILVTRRGARDGATKQYMLCGRKHLGHITFDEVDFGVGSLCPGFVYLVSYPVTLQQTRLYLWKGSACSTEEISAARLAAMDLSETGEIIEVDNGAEFASFLRIFGVGTTKASVPKPTAFWKQKAQAPHLFEARLFRIRQAEPRPPSIFSSFFRRPSWNASVSTARSPSREPEEIKAEVKHISPFTQNDLEAEGIYLLDAHSELFVLLGPLFASQPEHIYGTLLGQALLFTADYATVAAESRPTAPKASVVFKGIPPDAKMLFRHWDESRGFWGTAGLMAGSRVTGGGSNELKMLPLDDVVKAVCQQWCGKEASVLGA